MSTNTETLDLTSLDTEPQNFAELWLANRNILKTITARVENPQPKAVLKLSAEPQDNLTLWQMLSGFIQTARQVDDLQRGSVTVDVSADTRITYSYGGLQPFEDKTAPCDQVTAACTLNRLTGNVTSIEVVTGIPDFIADISPAA